MNIYVSNLSRSVTEEMLKALFEEKGKVTSTKIIRDKFTREPRGFGFVEMESEAEGQAAIEALHGREFEGRKIVVNKALATADQARNRRPQNGGSGGGFNRGGNSRGGFGGDRGGFGSGGGRPRRFE